DLVPDPLLHVARHAGRAPRFDIVEASRRLGSAAVEISHRHGFHEKGRAERFPPMRKSWQRLPNRSTIRERFEPAHAVDGIIVLTVRKCFELPSRRAGPSSSIAKNASALPSGGEFGPIACILVSATVEERLEIAIGDFVAIEPVVRQLDAVFSAAGDEHHAGEFGADRPQTDRTRVEVRPAYGGSWWPDFESGLDWLEAALPDPPAQHAERSTNTPQRRRAKRNPLSFHIVQGFERDVRARRVGRDRHGHRCRSP